MMLMIKKDFKSFNTELRQLELLQQSGALPGSAAAANGGVTASSPAHSSQKAAGFNFTQQPVVGAATKLHQNSQMSLSASSNLRSNLARNLVWAFSSRAIAYSLTLIFPKILGCIYQSHLLLSLPDYSDLLIHLRHLFLCCCHYFHYFVSTSSHFKWLCLLALLQLLIFSYLTMIFQCTSLVLQHPFVVSFWHLHWGYFNLRHLIFHLTTS